MQLIKYILIFLTMISVPFGYCQDQPNVKGSGSEKNLILPGAYLTGEYLILLKEKRVGIVANQTSVINQIHLVDTLISLGVNVVKIFGPEHGFRGDQPDGKEVRNTTDARTGIEIVSLYGDHKKPNQTDLINIDLMIFDIQDVGARFYTYISTLTYVMEACAEKGIPLIVLDRPNPNGYYIDGPVLDTAYSSFVGLHPVPVVYGMTIGEYAAMVNGEKWLAGGKPCNLTVVKCANYMHNSRYQLAVSPSPNLQDMKAIYLYPSLCLFEGTVVSVGRGTDSPFKIFGHPDFVIGSYTFTPKPIKGVSENPPLKNQLCYGQNLTEAAEIIIKEGHIELFWLMEAYKILHTKTEFFSGYFDKLAGNHELREKIIAGTDEATIRKSWQPKLELFKEIRKKYLLYPDFR